MYLELFYGLVDIRMADNKNMWCLEFSFVKATLNY